MVRGIEERIASVTHLPADHGEGMQVMLLEPLLLLLLALLPNT